MTSVCQNTQKHTMNNHVRNTEPPNHSWLNYMHYSECTKKVCTTNEKVMTDFILIQDMQQGNNSKPYMQNFIGRFIYSVSYTEILYYNNYMSTKYITEDIYKG